MKFSEMLVEYLDLREEERSESDWTPIAFREERRKRKQELLDGMDALTFTPNGVNACAKEPGHG